MDEEAARQQRGAEYDVCRWLRIMQDVNVPSGIDLVALICVGCFSGV